MTEYQSTHALGCWDCGQKHYECAVGEIKRLRSELEIVRGTAEHYRNLWRARGDLLRDADAALKDLGACDTPDCSEPACLKVRHRIQLDLAALDPAAARAVD